MTFDLIGKIIPKMDNLWLFYLLPILFIWGGYLGLRSRNSRTSKIARKISTDSGVLEPATLHPVIDHTVCLGCGSCVNACPEQPSHAVLGLIGGKSHLVGPAYCIGHGACETACPHGAITLVFGSEKRGVDIPRVSPTFETNVKGIYIAGELGGMGLIRNALVQGSRALESAYQSLDKKDETTAVDVFIIGAGPAGFSATLKAHEMNLKYCTVEQESLGGTVFNFPRGKIVMTAPVTLPSIGEVNFKETTKEELLNFWEKAEIESGIRINYQERVEDVTGSAGCFEVKTSRGLHRARTILLAIGRNGTPRKLGVDGEDKPKVIYRLIDPEEYRGKRVCVVGGGDSALETAISVAGVEGTTVTLSYRSATFGRAKEKNRNKLERAEKEGTIRVLRESNVISVQDDTILLDFEGEEIEIPNDVLIVNTGGILPTGFIKKMGIEVDTKYGTA